jgi:predicted DNA-binding transcriptional regulator AlpA
MYSTQIVTLPQLKEIVPFSKTKIYSLIKYKGFPSALHIEGGRKSFWRAGDVKKWLEENLK